MPWLTADPVIVLVLGLLPPWSFSGSGSASPRLQCQAMAQESTAQYLGLKSQSDPIEVSRAFDI